MIFYIKKYQLLLLLSVLLTSSLYAFQADNPYLDEAIEQRNFDKKNWKKITSELDYSKDIGDALQKRKGKERTPATETSPPWNGPSKGMMTFLKFLLILGGIVAIAVILGYMIGAFKDAPKNKKISTASVKTLDLEHVEENIHETDLEQLIRQAVGEGQYSIAIRLYYLLIIKELSLKEHILWKRDKTNTDYLRELEQTNFFAAFRQVTSVYERAWYGDVIPKEGDYVAVKEDFERLVRQIRL